MKSKLKKYYPELTGLIVFITYLFTLASTVVQIDAGELATVQATLGIAHPTGYPLFTLIGHLFLLLPFFTKIYLTNLLASIWCSLAVVLFIRNSEFIFSRIALRHNTQNTNSNNKKSKSEIASGNFQESVKIFASILGGLVLAYSKTFWAQSTSVEVYSLQIFLFNLIIFFLLRAYYSPDGQKTHSFQVWILTSIALALGFSNHMTTLLILPGLAFLFYKKEGISTKSLIVVLKMIVLFLLILTAFYLYLPIRASMNPKLNWGNPVNWENFWRHFTGAQYQVWLFSSFVAAKKQFVYFLQNLPSEFATIGLIIAFVGIFYLYKKERNIFWFLIINFIFTVLYSINYDIHDIDSYFLLSYIMLGFFPVFGFAGIFEYLYSKNSNSKLIFSTALIIPLFILVMNFPKVDQSGNYTFEDYTKTILNGTGKNSIIFTYQWDYLVSPSYYFQYVENYRPDVTVIDKELLRRSWYYHQLETDHPNILRKMKPTINEFLQALKPFERGEKYNTGLLERLYQRIMTELISTNIKNHNYYIAPELVTNEMRKGEFVLPQGYTIVPYNLLFKVVKGNNYVAAPMPEFKIRFYKHKNSYIKLIEKICASMLENRAIYELKFNKIDKAKIYIYKLKSEFPKFILPKIFANL